ncbi:MAG: EAL domain-containing protein, partial [Pygmaiobacter sp.]
LSAKDRLEAFLKHFDPVRRSLIGTHGLTLAAGVVDVQPDQTIDTLLDMARLACKKAKQSGMLCCYYGEEQNRQYELREKICAHQQDALQNKEFQLYLQPTFSAQGQQVIGADAWVRWNNRSAGQLRTSQFLPVFQENGFVLDLDYELMGQICAAIASWPETCRVPITLRIDRLHFAMTDFISRLCEICEKHGVAHRYIGLEIPENAFLGDKTRLQQVLRELKRQKFYLVLGSFGSGWSSLETLTDYPFDALRLSTDFFDEAVGKKHLVAENICAMAKNLGLRVFAADVATAQQAEFLHRIGVDAVQGDYYRPTLSAAEYRTEICKMRR